MSTKKAYTVREDYDGHCVVVFARSNAEARRKGGNELNLSFEEVESCRRAPEFDAYAEAGDVPPLVMIEHGWWYECGYCGRQVSSEGYMDDDEQDPMEPSTDGKFVYCNGAHQMAHWAARRETAAREHAAIEACALKFFGLPITNLRGVQHYSVGGHDLVDACDFDFPGRKGIDRKSVV